MKLKADSKNFALRLNGLNQILGGKDLTPGIIDIYFKALEQFEMDEVIKAITKAAVSCKFFPKPVELIEFVQGKIEDKAEIECNKAFEALKRIGPYQSVCFDDFITQAVIKQGFGGWVKFCGESMVETEHFERKDFIKLYESYSRSGIKNGGYLPGISEIENNSNGKNVNPEIIMIGNSEICKQIMKTKTGQENMQVSSYNSVLKQIEVK